jgi:hypothetical protein
MEEEKWEGWKERACRGGEKEQQSRAGKGSSKGGREAVSIKPGKSDGTPGGTWYGVFHLPNTSLKLPRFTWTMYSYTSPSTCIPPIKSSIVNPVYYCHNYA